MEPPVFAELEYEKAYWWMLYRTAEGHVYGQGVDGWIRDKFRYMWE